jgi:hypothetical protein
MKSDKRTRGLTDVGVENSLLCDQCCEAITEVYSCCDQSPHEDREMLVLTTVCYVISVARLSLRCIVAVINLPSRTD